MPTLAVEGRSLDLNEEGFLVVPETWDDAVAVALAKQEEQLEALTEEHWTVIRFIRQHFLDNQAAPMVRASTRTATLCAPRRR